MSDKKYRFTRDDFQPPMTQPLHFDMLFDVQPDRVQVTLQATYRYVGPQALTQLSLNCKDLKIVSVDRLESFTALGDGKDFVTHVASLKNARPQQFQVDTEQHMLHVTMDTAVQPHSEFVLKTVSIATPTPNILEGLYFDYTPDGAPQTIITQCQQYGFQRICPCIDAMDAKCFYTTTIMADKKYTNMITNGDLANGYFEAESGLPIYHSVEEVTGTVDHDRHVLQYYNHKVCMAPYLFFLGVGTYVTYRQMLEFPDGDECLLEILTIPGRATDSDAQQAMKMLHDSILWVMISLGPESTQHCAERKQIYALLDEREDLKSRTGPLVTSSLCAASEKNALSPQDAHRLADVRTQLKSALQAWTKTGYKYTGAIYREIAMDNSYYGGMENVGNTTIVSSCLCPSCTMADHSYEYMERVKVHEYYHNINGSQVTGQSPFEIWLNEAVTVHMERKRYAHLFGANYTRLSEVTYMFRPTLGPLAQDRSVTSLAVEPQGFNQTQELVSVVTYSKAPEFVRMVELILGQQKFDQALDVYHTRYSFGNATTAQWIACMEEVSKMDFQYLAKCWLKRPGFPSVEYKTQYDEQQQKYTVSMTQTGFEDQDESNNAPWDIPIDWALVKDGKVIKEGLYRFTEASGSFDIDTAIEPDFISFARGYSFFGTSDNKSGSREELTLQANTDPDVVNRYFAYRTLAEREKARIIENLLLGNSNISVDEDYVKLHSSILLDSSISASTRALTLAEPNSTSRTDLSHHYIAIHSARRALLQAVWYANSSSIVQLYNELESQNVSGCIKDQIHDRALKRHLLNLMAQGAKDAVLNQSGDCVVGDPVPFATRLYNNSTFMSDRSSALRVLLECGDRLPNREALQAEWFKEWSDVPNLLEMYIGIIGSLNVDNVDEQVRNLMSSNVFNINLSAHTRTLTRGLSAIRQFSVATEKGRELMAYVFTTIGVVNQMSAYPILKCFDDMSKFDKETQQAVRATLEKMQGSIDKVAQESLYNQLNIMLQT